MGSFLKHGSIAALSAESIVKMRVSEQAGLGVKFDYLEVPTAGMHIKMQVLQ